MQRHFLLTLIVILMASCGGTSVVTPQGDTTTGEPAPNFEPTEAPTIANAGSSTSALGSATDATGDPEAEAPSAGSSTTQGTTPAPTTTATQIEESPPSTSTTTTLLNAPESFEPNKQLDFSSAQPDA